MTTTRQGRSKTKANVNSADVSLSNLQMRYVIIRPAELPGA